MGFKSRARKRRKDANASSETSQEDGPEEYEGQIKCDITHCDNWADKKIGGRKMAYDRAVEVWGASGGGQRSPARIISAMRGSSWDAEYASTSSRKAWSS